MRIPKIAALALVLTLASPGLAAAQEALAAGAITGALTGALLGVRSAQPSAGLRGRHLVGQQRPTTPVGRVSDLLRIGAGCRRIHLSARRRLPATPLAPLPLRALFALSPPGFSPLGFGAWSLPRPCP